MDQDFDALILEAERRAERLIAFLRIVTAIAIFAVYRVVVVDREVPAELDLDDQLVLARLTMLGYALIGIGALWLTSRHRHRRWHSYGFVTADALFVVISLYLSLKSQSVSGHYVSTLPSLWLVPLVLSFNALRLSWRVMAFAGVVMLAGLAAVALVPGRGRDGVIPQSLYGYFGDPPNVMRYAMVVLAVLILTAAVVRTRKLLRTALDQSRRRALLTNFMPRQVARIIEETDNAELRQGHVMTVVIMFVDLRDFTARAETMPPERVSAFLTDYRRLVREAVDARDGFIDKFIGDGAMAVFTSRRRRGPPELAGDAVACARDIVSRVADWSDGLVAAGRRPVRVGIGVHMGESFVGAVGDEERLEFTVVGDVVNTAARLEETAKHVGCDIVVSRKVLDMAGIDDPAFAPLPDVSVRGRRGSVPACAFTAR